MSETLPGWIVGMTLWTAVLLCVAAIADRMLARRVRPAWRVLLYTVVFVRLALPVDWHSPLALVSFDGPQASAPAVDPPALEVPRLAVDRPVPDSAPIATASASWTSADVLALGWIGGTLLLLGLLAGARIRLGRRLRTAVPARTRVTALARAIDVVEHDAEGPLTFGVLRPTIVLPRDLVDTLSDEQLRHVLAHELAHVRRRDPLLALAVAVVVACAWPVIPVWIAAARIRQLVEQAADDHCLVHGGIASARAYGRTLLLLAQRSSRFTAALHLGGFAGLRGRIAALRKRRRASTPAQVVAVVGIAGLALACGGIEGEAEDRCATLVVEATMLHDAAERAQDADTRAAAAEAYDAFAHDCSTRADYGEVLYYRAELLWAIAVDRHRAGDLDAAREGFATAYAAFNEALDAAPGRFTKDAAIAQVLAKRNEHGVEVGPLRPEDNVVSNRLPRSEYTAEELELLAAYDTYEQHVDDPNDAELQKVRYHRAALAMRHNRFDEARPVLEELLRTSDGADVHAWAAQMLDEVLGADPRAGLAAE